jgi:hypothetical protein
MAQRKVAAAFVEPMLLLQKDKLPEGPGWLYEIKLDGYRALAVKTGKKEFSCGRATTTTMISAFVTPVSCGLSVICQPRQSSTAK